MADIGDLPFNQVTETLDKIKPDKASANFGVELAVEAGNLTALIVKGWGKGNLEITLERR